MANNNQNTTKEQERAELHRAIWQIANDLRGSVDGWDFKSYVLGMLFYRFISGGFLISVTSVLTCLNSPLFMHFFFIEYSPSF